MGDPRSIHPTYPIMGAGSVGVVDDSLASPSVFFHWIASVASTVDFVHRCTRNLSRVPVGFFSPALLFATMSSWTDSTEWFYLGDDGVETLGPFSTAEIADAHQGGGVDEETWVWNEGMDGWKQLKDHEEFNEYLVGLSYIANSTDSGTAAEPEAPSALAAMPVAPTETKRKASKDKMRRTSIARGGVSAAGFAPPPATQKSDFTKLKELSQRSYYDQAQWLLNAYWKQNDGKLASPFGEDPAECEKVWDYARLIAKLDKEKGKDGNELDEFQAHVFLEKSVGALTVKKMREVLAEVDVDFNKKVSLTEFYIYHYRLDYHLLVNNVVDDKESREKLDAAKAALAQAQQAAEEASAASAKAEQDAEDSATAAKVAKQDADDAAMSAQKAAESESVAVAKEQDAEAGRIAATAAREEANLSATAATASRQAAETAAVDAAASATASETAAAESATRSEAAKVSAEEAKEKEAAAVEEENICREAEEKLAAVEAEAVAASDALTTAKNAADAALADLHAQQKAFDDKCTELETIANSNAGTVTKGKASAELAQLRSKDPLPLDRAKINQGAAVRKVGKAAKKAKEKADAAQAEREVATVVRERAAAVRATAEEARAVADKDAEEAQSAAEEAAAAAALAKEQAEAAIQAESKAKEEEATAKEEEAKAVELEEAAIASHEQAVEARAAAVAARELAEKEAADAAASAAAAMTAAELAAESAVAARTAAADAEVAMVTAEEALAVVKTQCQNTTTQGTLWWLDREWTEAKKYLSAAKIAKLEAKGKKSRAEEAAFQSRV